MTALQRKMKRKAKEPRVVLLRPNDRISVDAFGRRHILVQKDITMNIHGPTEMTFGQDQLEYYRKALEGFRFTS